MKRSARTVPGVLVSLLVLSTPSCSLFEEHEDLECKVIELGTNSSSQYYDAVVRVEHLSYALEREKSRFYVSTLSSIYAMEDWSFIQEGKDAAELEEGDIFVMPLNKPEWKFLIIGDLDGETGYSSVDFRVLLPEEDRFHSLRSEATKVALSIELTEEGGILKPDPEVLTVRYEDMSHTVTMKNATSRNCGNIERNINLFCMQLSEFVGYSPNRCGEVAMALEAATTRVEDIIPDKEQPRKEFSRRDLEELARSYNGKGPIYPVVVRPIAESEFMIVGGEMRWKAAKSQEGLQPEGTR